MIDVASLVIIGRLTRDAEVKTLPSGDLVANLRLASSSRKKKGGEWVDAPVYLDVEHFPRGDAAWLEYLKKGKQVCCQGDLRMDQWTQDGVERTKHYLAARNIQLLSSPRQGAENDNSDAPMWADRIDRGQSAGDMPADYGRQAPPPVARQAPPTQRTFGQAGYRGGDPFAPQAAPKPAPEGQPEFTDDDPDIF